MSHTRQQKDHVVHRPTQLQEFGFYLKEARGEGIKPEKGFSRLFFSVEPQEVIHSLEDYFSFSGGHHYWLDSCAMVPINTLIKGEKRGRTLTISEASFVNACQNGLQLCDPYYKNMYRGYRRVQDAHYRTLENFLDQADVSITSGVISDLERGVSNKLLHYGAGNKGYQDFLRESVSRKAAILSTIKRLHDSDGGLIALRHSDMGPFISRYCALAESEGFSLSHTDLGILAHAFAEIGRSKKPQVILTGDREITAMAEKIAPEISVSVDIQNCRPIHSFKITFKRDYNK